MADRIEGKRDKRDKAEKQRKELLKRASKLKKFIGRLEAGIAKIRKERDLLDQKGHCLDGASMPLALKLVLLDARANGWDGVVNSADRTQAHCDDCSDKSSQAELYQAYLNGTGAPANPPGTGTHEYVDDGTAYGNRGASLAPWQLGLDVSYGDQLLSVLAKLGYKARRPYGHEPWHFNFTENPRERLIQRGRI